MDEGNQGWSSKKDLQGKWFKLSYVRREQPKYAEWPIVMVEIISEAVIIEK